MLFGVKILIETVEIQSPTALRYTQWLPVMSCCNKIEQCNKIIGVTQQLRITDFVLHECAHTNILQ